jgi:Rrf2 family nitric oxide-sensitive transcriptional repressor
MRLTLYSDLALRTLFSLATTTREGSNVAEIAKAYGVSEHHLRKVVYRLAQVGLVETTRGRGGGLRLAVNPSQITIGSVVRQMEPDFAIAECLSSDPTRCALVGLCGSQKIFAEALGAWFEVLDRHTLADAIARSEGLQDFLALRKPDFSDR